MTTALGTLLYRGWRIYNVVGCVKDFLNTPRPQRAERPDGVPGARFVSAKSPWCFFITRSAPQREVQLVPPLTNASPKLQPTSSR